VIVDTHTHLLPVRLAVAVRTFFEEHITSELAYPLDHRDALDQLHSQGVTAIWNLPYAHGPGIAGTACEAFHKVCCPIISQIDDSR
jgi:hypothetical protein